ncbi:MAG: O-antigen ligase family protein [Candidatus Hydrogenedentota bacterium]
MKYLSLDRIKESFIVAFRKGYKYYLISAFVIFIPFYDYLQTLGLSLTPFLLLTAILLFLVKENNFDIKSASSFLIFLIFCFSRIENKNAEKFFEIMILFIIFIFGYLAGSNKRITIMLHIIGIIAVIYAIYQIGVAYKDYIAMVKMMDIPYKEKIIARLQDRRAYSFFILPSLFANFLVFLTALSFDKKLIQNKIINYLFTMVYFCGILLSKSIGGILIFSLIFIVNLLKDNINRLFKIMVVFILILGTSFLIINRKDELASKNNPVIQRTYNWYSTIEMTKDYYLHGVGFGNFYRVYPAYVFKEKNIPQYTHNLYLQMISETGIFIASLFFTFLVIILYLCYVKRKLFVYISFLLFNFIDIGFYFISISGLYFYYFGSILKNRDKRKEPPLKRLNYYIIAICIVCLFTASVSKNISKMTSDIGTRYYDYVYDKYREFVINNPAWMLNYLQSATNMNLIEELIKYVPAEGFYFSIKERYKRELYLKNREFDKYRISLLKEKRFKEFGSDQTINFSK